MEAAAKSGAHALKLQTYTADTMTLDLREGEFWISDPNSLWEGNSLYNSSDSFKLVLPQYSVVLGSFYGI